MGLVAVLLPDPMNQLPDVMKNDDTILFRTQWLAKDTTASSNQHDTYTALFQVKDLKKLTNLDVFDGTTFLNDITNFFNKKWRNPFEKDGTPCIPRSSRRDRSGPHSPVSVPRHPPRTLPGDNPTDGEMHPLDPRVTRVVGSDPTSPTPCSRSDPR